MELNYNKYPAYRDSGVDWLGEIPEGWDIKPLKSIAKIKSITNKPYLDLLSVYLDKGVIKFDDVVAKRTNVTSLDLSNYQLVEKDDFVLNNQQAWRGSVGVSNHLGIVSPAYIVLELSDVLNPMFANYYFRNGKTVAQYLVSSKGVGTIQRNLYWPHFKGTYISIPPIKEQTTIAQHLDQKTKKIDQAIAQKEKLISLIKERKQIIIQELVTGKKVWNKETQSWTKPSQVKDSGVEWIGEIPEGWEVKKMSFLTKKIGDGLHGTPEYSDESDYFFINGNNLSKGYIEITEQTKTVNKRQYVLHKKPLTEQTLLLSINGTIGNVAFYNNEKVMLGKSAAYLNFEEGENLKFIRQYLISDAFKYYYELELSGSTINNLSLYSVSKIPVVYPEKEEQTAIVSYIETQSTKIDQAIALQQKQIERLKEYKMVLIDSLVTGKVLLKE